MLHSFVKDGLRGKSDTTIKTYAHAIKQFADWLAGAGTNLNDFCRSDVQQYVSYLAAKKKSAATINKIYNAIKSFSKFAKKMDCVEDIIVIKPTDYKQQAPKALSKIERLKLIRDVDRSENRRDYAILMTLLYCGLRVSELVSLDRSDVDSTDRKGELIVRNGKGRKERVLPLNIEVRRAIAKYLEERTDDHEALFISTWNRRISVRSVQHLFEKYDINAHMARHTFITDLVRSNQDIAIVQALSGHSSADMVLRYSQPTEEDKLRAVEGMYVG